MTRSKWIGGSDHWVVKIGSAVFLRDARLDRPAFVGLVEDISALVASGKRVTVVSSGAVALGREHLDGAGGGTTRPVADVPDLQAYAAVGQSRLMRMYADEFGHYGNKVAQILFSRDDLDDRQRFLNARLALEQVHALEHVHGCQVIPVVNENDTVATEELRFGDNDRLAAMTCGLVDADLLVLLSDVAGVFDIEDSGDADPVFGARIRAIAADDPQLQQVAGPSTSGVGRGGMVSKVDAAQTAARMGVPTVIGPGKRRGVLGDIAGGADVGTLVWPGSEQAVAGKKVWLGAGARPVGRILCDAGAVDAMRHQGASLLPTGVIEVDGTFAEGAVVELADAQHSAFARGLAVYNSQDIARIAGHHSDAIESLLGFRIVDTVVHRDSLVVL